VILNDLLYWTRKCKWDRKCKSKIVAPLFVRQSPKYYGIKYTSYTHYHSNFEAGGGSQP